MKKSDGEQEEKEKVKGKRDGEKSDGNSEREKGKRDGKKRKRK